jgi:hypothetical protein
MPVFGPSLRASELGFSAKEPSERSSWNHNISRTPYVASPDKVPSGVLAKFSSNIALYTNFGSINTPSAMSSRSFGGFFREKRINLADTDADAGDHYEVSN